MAKRQWSRAFTPKVGVTINISQVPTTLRQRFQAKCKREGKSQRNLLLGWIRNWVADRRPDEDALDDEVPAGPPFADTKDTIASSRSPV